MVGVNTTSTVHAAPAATVVAEPQVPADVTAKSPVAAIPEIASGASPLFVTVTVAGALVVPTCCGSKPSAAGFSVTAGAMPVPLSVTVCGLSAASSATLSAPARDPVAVGVKTTSTVHAALGATLAPLAHVPVEATAKSPLASIVAMVNGASPLFVSVTVCAALVLPTR
jgi:hypothetical protein